MQQKLKTNTYFLRRARFHLEDVKANCLGKRAALADRNDITLLDPERGGDVGGEVRVPLLVTPVLLHVVKVIASYNDSALHLSRYDKAL